MQGTFSKNRWLVLSLLAAAFFNVACDKNIARPEDLAALTSVSISGLSVDNPELILGADGNLIEGTTISWEVVDEEGLVESVELVSDPGATVQVSTSGTRPISPTVSTLYTLNVYVDGEIAKKKFVYVKVVDLSGNIVEEVPEEETEVTAETACADTADDDSDGATDCDDTDCAQDAACADPVYEFTSVASTATESTLVGDNVTISWTSTFQNVRVYRDNQMDARLYDADDKFEFTAEDDATEIVLTGMVDGGEIASSDPITVDAVTVPPETFDEEVTVSFTVSPSGTLLKGQQYTLSWSVNGAASVALDGVATNSGQTYTANSDRTHTLSVTDGNGETKDYSKSVTVKTFASAGTDAGSGITSVTAGPSADEYYFLSDSKIYHTEDALATDAQEVATDGIKTSDYAITAIAECNDKLFVGSTGGIYVSEGGASFTPIISTGSQSVTALYAMSDCTLIVGTENEVFAAASCDDASPTGYCQSDKEDFEVDANTYFYQFLRDASNSSRVFAITDKGVFRSDDGGASFAGVAEVTEDVTGGGWSKSGGGFLWGSETVYEWDSATGTFKEIEGLAKANKISAATRSGSYYLVATEDGIGALYNGTEYFTTHETDAAFLIQTGSAVKAISSDGGVDSVSLGGGLAGKLKVTDMKVSGAISAAKLGASFQGILGK